MMHIVDWEMEKRRIGRLSPFPILDYVITTYIVIETEEGDLDAWAHSQYIITQSVSLVENEFRIMELDQNCCCEQTSNVDLESKNWGKMDSKTVCLEWPTHDHEKRCCTKASCISSEDWNDKKPDRSAKDGHQKDSARGHPARAARTDRKARD